MRPFFTQISDTSDGDLNYLLPVSRYLQVQMIAKVVVNGMETFRFVSKLFNSKSSTSSKTQRPILRLCNYIDQGSVMKCKNIFIF